MGHWHRECPSKDEPKPEKEARFLDKDKFGMSSEVHFCGFLETEFEEIPEDNAFYQILDKNKGKITVDEQYTDRHYKTEDAEYKLEKDNMYQEMGPGTSTFETSADEPVSVHSKFTRSSDWQSDSFDRPHPAACNFPQDSMVSPDGWEWLNHPPMETSSIYICIYIYMYIYIYMGFWCYILYNLGKHQLHLQPN